MQYIGKIDKQKIGYYANKISNDEIVLTEERKLHIYEEHKKDYQLIMKNIKNGVLNPNEVLKDNKNKDTLFFLCKFLKIIVNFVLN